MFIKRGDRRINLEFIKEYKPGNKVKNFYIDITYMDGSKENYSFYDSEGERNNLLKILDDHFLLTKN